MTKPQDGQIMPKQKKPLSAEEMYRKYFKKGILGDAWLKDAVDCLNEYGSQYESKIRKLQATVEDRETQYNWLSDRRTEMQETMDCQGKIIESKDREIAELKSALLETTRLHISAMKETATERQRSQKLVEALKSAMAIKDLWLPYPDTCAPEHESEAIAIQSMHNAFIDALSAHESHQKESEA